MDPPAEKSLTHAAFKIMAVCAECLSIYVGPVLPRQVGQFRISATPGASMPVAVIFDAFGTLIKISKGSSPYRKILQIGIEQGRRPQPRDGENVLSLPMDLHQAADFFGISVNPSVMASLEEGLNRELAEIEAYPDGLRAVRLLQEANIKVAVCSNLAKPYASAIERLYPRLDAYSYSFEVGAVKPSFKIYSHALQAVSGPPGEVWMIGDSQECDCKGPTAFGMRGFWLDRNGLSIHSSLDQFTAEVLSVRF